MTRRRWTAAGVTPELLRVQLDDELLLHLRVDLGAGRMVCTSTRILSGTTSSQAGTCRSPTSALATMNGVISSDFGCTSMMSVSLTW